jgi:hypothetical protein
MKIYRKQSNKASWAIVFLVMLTLTPVPAAGYDSTTVTPPWRLTRPVPCINPLDAQHCAELNDGKVIVGSEETIEGDADEGANDATPASTESSVADALVAVCLDTRAEAVAQGIPVPAQVEEVCGDGTQAVTQELVLQAFRELPLYRGLIHTDPQGWTLVNLDTHFWCADAAGRSCAQVGGREQRVVLLGRQVRVRPRVVSYTWSFGDGTEERATGGTGRVAHAYRTRRTATVQVTLTWTADFAVAGQPFQPIVGTTTTVSPALPLLVRTARPVLVGGGN